MAEQATGISMTVEEKMSCIARHYNYVAKKTHMTSGSRCRYEENKIVMTIDNFPQAHRQYKAFLVKILEEFGCAISKVKTLYYPRQSYGAILVEYTFVIDLKDFHMRERKKPGANAVDPERIQTLYRYQIEHANVLDVLPVIVSDEGDTYLILSGSTCMEGARYLKSDIGHARCYGKFVLLDARNDELAETLMQKKMITGEYVIQFKVRQVPYLLQDYNEKKRLYKI